MLKLRASRHISSGGLDDLLVWLRASCCVGFGGQFLFFLLVAPPDLAIAGARAHSEAVSCFNAWRLRGMVVGTAVGIGYYGDMIIQEVDLITVRK